MTYELYHDTYSSAFIYIYLVFVLTFSNTCILYFCLPFCMSLDKYFYIRCLLLFTRFIYIFFVFVVTFSNTYILYLCQPFVDFFI